MPPWTLVSPASRGIGLQLARHLLRNSTLPVVATARGDLAQTRDSILDGLGSENASTARERLHVLHLDFTDEQSISQASKECSSLFPQSSRPASDFANASHLHTAFILPGILHPEKSPSQLDASAIHETFTLNTIGPLLMLRHFASFLPKKSSKVLPLPSDAGCINKHAAVWSTMSARVGSISDNQLGGWYSYRASKAAVNSFTKTFDNFLKVQSGDKAMAVALHPGTVKTGLSKEFWGNVKEEKLFSAEFAVQKLVGVLESLKSEQRGKIWDWKGEEIPP